MVSDLNTVQGAERVVTVTWQRHDGIKKSPALVKAPGIVAWWQALGRAVRYQFRLCGSRMPLAVRFFAVVVAVEALRAWANMDSISLVA